ncbi:TetR/AcrR family transcriptional regulator [bacterium]|nr:TetR/AcrR family transcriptional regulator [bacterium]
MKTKQVILKESLRLFNKNSFELSTTNLIANESNVLEGSLWYHFNSKLDIISNHLDIFLDLYNSKKKHTQKNESIKLIQGLFSMYEVVWDYRYLFRDSFEQISIKNPNLYKRIVDINKMIDDWVRESVIHSKNIGILIIEEIDTEDIVEIILIIGRYWLDFSIKKYPSKSDAYLRKKGINLLIKSFYPYLSEDSKIIMDSIYESV